MTRHLEEMQHFIKLADHVYEMSSPTEEEDISEELVDSEINPILEDLGDLEFKLRSYRDSTSNQDIAAGIEQGLGLAADLVSRLIERYSN